MRRITTDRARLAGERGMTAVWVALMLVVLMLFAALAIDGGQAYSSRRQSQNASDAGVMAGIRQLVEIKFPAPDVTPPTTDTVAQQVLNQAHNSGADTDADGVECYVVDRAEARLTGDLCAGGTAATFTPTSAMVGVEVRARQTKETNFGRVVGIDDTSARTSAVARIENYVSETGSPFIMCGSQADAPADVNPAEYSYDLLAKDTSTDPPTYSVKESAIGKYYALQADKVPVCGGDSQNFKGLLDGSYPVILGDWSYITSGNRSDAVVDEAVLGVRPCDEDQINGIRPFDGCGLLIPISSVSEAQGADFRTKAQVWSVWLVWKTNGQGSTNPRTIGGSGYGEGCQDPIVGDFQGQVGVVRHCGQLLGPIQLSGGEGGGAEPLNRGAIVVKLVR